MPSLIMRTSAVYWTPVMVSSDLPLTLAAACGLLTILFSTHAFDKHMLAVAGFVNRTNKLRFCEYTYYGFFSFAQVFFLFECGS